MWNFHGSTNFLERQAKRLGSTVHLARIAHHNPEIKRVSVLVCQLCERYHRTVRERGEAIFYETEHRELRGTLSRAEEEVVKLHMLAGASEAMLAETYEKLGLPAPSRPFTILADSDDGGPSPASNGAPHESRKP